MEYHVRIELAICTIQTAACTDRRLGPPHRQFLSPECITCTLMPCHQWNTIPLLSKWNSPDHKLETCFDMTTHNMIDCTYSPALLRTIMRRCKPRKARIFQHWCGVKTKHHKSLYILKLTLQPSGSFECLQRKQIKISNKKPKIYLDSIPAYIVNLKKRQIWLVVCFCNKMNLIQALT